MSFLLSVPSKTFLLGEYLATQGGTAIIANTEPRFSLKVKMASGPTPTKNVSDSSPAGQFLKKHANEFSGFDLDFFDPHHGAGGFGASTAQYALLCALHYCVKAGLRPQEFKSHHGFSCLQEYIGFAWSGEGLKPSGADLISQLCGQLAIINTEKKVAQNVAWTFSKIDFALIRTSQKLATHEHLKELKTVPAADLQLVVDKAVSALAQKQDDVFVKSVQLYHEQLLKMNCVAQHTLQLIENLPSFVLASKGCGAMGADVVLVIYQATDKDHLLQELQRRNLNVIATSKELSPGYLFQTGDVIGDSVTLGVTP